MDEIRPCCLDLEKLRVTVFLSWSRNCFILELGLAETTEVEKFMCWLFEDGFSVEGKTVRVKPTTLLFTSALRAVAKSHETANKLNGGMSKKNRRRESITSYHGRLARKIVVLAEQAEQVLIERAARLAGLHEVHVGKLD